MAPAYDLPPDARFTCQQCAGCCYHWFVYLTPDEYERLRSHDWAADSPRLGGRVLFEEQVVPGQGGQRAVRLAKIDGACAFLEPDHLCLIHKVQGMAAKLAHRPGNRNAARAPGGPLYRRARRPYKGRDRHP